MQRVPDTDVQPYYPNGGENSPQLSLSRKRGRKMESHMRVAIVMLALGVALGLGASTPALAKQVSQTAAESICGGEWTKFSEHQAGCDITCGAGGKHICDYNCTAGK